MSNTTSVHLHLRPQTPTCPGARPLARLPQAPAARFCAGLRRLFFSRRVLISGWESCSHLFFSGFLWQGVLSLVHLLMPARASAPPSSRGRVLTLQCSPQFPSPSRPPALTSKSPPRKLAPSAAPRFPLLHSLAFLRLLSSAPTLHASCLGPLLAPMRRVLLGPLTRRCLSPALRSHR